MSPSSTSSTKSPASIEPAYTSLDQCATAMRKIAEIDTQLKEIEADASSQINPIREAADKKAAPLNAKRLRLATDLEEFIRNQYPKGTFEDGSRTLEFPHGEVAFKDTPPSVNISKKGKWTEERVIAAILEVPKKFRDIMLKVETKLNKKGILSQLDQLEGLNLRDVGLTIEQSTNFHIKPKLESASPSSQKAAA